MAIPAISGMMNAGIQSIAPPTQSTTAAANAATDTQQVGNTFSNALDALQGAQDSADTLAKAAATGNLTDIHNYTIAATEAQFTTELTVAVRDRALASFNDIMRMQI